MYEALKVQYAVLKVQYAALRVRVLSMWSSQYVV